MAEPETDATEYRAFIDEERKFLADNREKVSKLHEDLPQQSLKILRRIASKIASVNADSEPSRSHWAMAQCREVLAGWDESLGIITKFEKAEKRVKKFDIAEAAKGTAE